MKALLSETPGGPDTLVLRELPTPQPGAGEVRIAVHACGLNFPDLLLIEDKYQFRPPRPFAPGVEVAGIVEAIGAGVAAPAIGTRVIAHLACGGLAEQVACPAEACLPIGETMPFDVAAGFLVTYGTSQHALVDRGALRTGETLLVLGAAGGVGLAAVETGKALGARVVAAVSSEAKAEVARTHGADLAIVYPRDTRDGKALAALFKQACSPDGAHVIYDPVGGDYAEAALRAIAWGGRFLVVGFPAGIPKIPLNLPLLKSCDIRGVFWGSFVERQPQQHLDNVRELLALYARGALHPHISARLPLERGAEALRQLASREATGKVVVTMRGS
jgi:NADPH2:quinone reductase